MKQKHFIGTALSGIAAGAVNGLFGAGGGMLLVPLLRKFTGLQEDEVFPASISVILPICVISLSVSAAQAPLPWHEAAPYLAGSAVGGFLAAKLGKKIPVLWLHRVLGVLILWGGVRYLC